MSPRARILGFGSAAGAVVAGTLCAVFVGGLTGSVLAILLITAGLGAVLLLVFLEVGLSEERELAKEEELRRGRAGTRARPKAPRWPRRPG